MRINNEDMLQEFYKHDKLNVALSSDIFFPAIGGVTFVIDNFVKALIATNRVNVVVITGEVKGYEDNLPYPVIRVKSVPIPKNMGDSLPLPNFDGKFKKLLKKLQIDVVDVHTVFGISTYLMKYGKKNNLPIIFHGHSKFSEEYKTIVKFLNFYKIMARRAYKIINKADLLLPVSISTLDNYINHNVKTKMEVLYHTSNMEDCIDKEEAFNYLHNNYGIEKEDNILTFVARLEMECKNIPFLLDSLKTAKDKGLKVKTFIIGEGKDYNKIVDKISVLGLQKNVIMTGEIRDRKILGYFYKIASLNVFPSVVDTYAIVKTEAGIFGTPSLLIKGSGAAECVTDNVNGYLEEENVDKYSDRIIKILQDKEKLQEVSSNAKESFSGGWGKIADKCIEYYNREIELKKQK